MILDNSQWTTFETCPLLYYEKYVKGIEFDWEKKGVNASHFGTRMHQLLEEHYSSLKGTPIPPYPEFPHEPTELEAQVTFASYLNHYPVEPFDVVDVEKTFRLPLAPFRCPNGHGITKPPEGNVTAWCDECGQVDVEDCLSEHEYCGKIDLLIFDPTTGLYSIMDHKTQTRSSQANNPKAWAAKSQATLYLWAAPQVYPEKPFRDLQVNVIRRQSEKGQIGPEFWPRQAIQRNDEQMTTAIRDLIIAADRIEEYKRKFPDGNWPADRNNCQDGNFSCAFYDPHLMGWSDELLQNYKPTVPYLDL